MSFLIFKYCMPVLLGYTLFVGLSGRFIPFIRPAKLTARPSWFLGLWAGLAVSLVVGIAMHLAYQMPIEEAKGMLKPVGVLLAALMIPGIIGYLMYRNDVSNEMRHVTVAEENESHAIVTETSNINLQIPTMDIVSADDRSIDAGGQPFEMDVQANDEYDHDDTLITDDVEEFGIADDMISRNDFEEIVDTGDNGSVSLLFDQVSVPDTTIDESVEIEAAAQAVEIDETPAVSESTDDIEAKAALEMEVDSNIELNAALNAKIEELQTALDSETHLRQHTETHLRITRKALKNLEGDTRDFETDKADALMAVEDELEVRVKETAAALARADREESQRIAAQTSIVNMKQDMLHAKRELRRNTEARAKALSTANKSVAFARQSVQARTRAEARIKQLEDRLKLSQETVSSLIAALDKEKARTQSDVTEMAKELILQQKRINEKRTLDEAGRRTPRRLTRRVAKKVS